MSNYSNFDIFIEAVINNNLNSVKNFFKHDYLYRLDKNQFTGFHIACDSGYTKIVEFFLDQNIDIEANTPNGWTGLHWSAGNGRDDVVSLLLERGANKEAETSRKYRPLHVAIIGNHAKSARLLLASGCNCHAKKDNKTPLELAIELKSDLCQSLLTKWTEYYKIFDLVRQKQYQDFTEAFLIERISVLEANTNKTVLDVAIESDFKECLEYVLLQDIDEKYLLTSLRYSLDRLRVSSDDFKAQYRLYRSIILNLWEEFEDYCLVGVVNAPWALTGESFLEVCVKYNRKIMVEYVIQSLLEPGQILWEALELAKTMEVVNIENVIHDRVEFLRIKERASYNRLHIAIQDNRVDVVRFLLNNELVDADECHQVVGSPLCFALSLGYGRCVQALLDHNVDVNVVNKYLQMSLHIAIENGMSKYIPSIIDQTQHVDIRDCFGFTALHHATISKDDATCCLLLEKGANLLSKRRISNREHTLKELTASSLPLSVIENPITLSLKLHRTIMPSLMNRIDRHNVNSLLPDASTFLHLSARLLLFDTCWQLLEKGALTNLPNKDGNTALHSLFLESFQNNWQNEGFLETLRILVDYGANINLVNKDGVSALHCAFKTDTRSIISATISRADKLDCKIEDILRICVNQWPDVLEQILALLTVPFKISLILHIIDIGLDDMIDFIFERLSEEFTKSILENCLHKCAMTDNETLFAKFARMNFDGPKLLSCGETLLTRLIVDNNEKYSLMLAKSELGERYIDLVNVYDKPPLYLAAERLSLKLCKYLVIESQSIDYKDANNETAMEKLFKSSINVSNANELKKIEKIIKSMINAGMDINRINKNRERAITFCRNPSLKQKLESFHVKTSRKRPISQASTSEERNICEVCLTNKINCQFGCGHPFCTTCANAVPICPKCRRPKTQIISLYLE